MKATASVIAVIILLTAGVFVGAYARSENWIKWPATKEGFRPHPFQFPGDPPITVSDGSLHAHSKRKGWVTDNDGDTTIVPKAKDNVFSKTCNMTVPVNGSDTAVTALLWTDEEKTYDLSPSPTEDVVVTITHDKGGTAADPNVYITLPKTNTGGPPTVRTGDGYFHKSEGNLGNRRHSRSGEVSEIVAKRGSTLIVDWTPGANQYNPHYTIGFCYN